MRMHRIFSSLLISSLALSIISVEFLPAVFALTEVREIKIKAAVSSTFKHDPNWEIDLKERVKFANEIFEPAFGLHFSISEKLDWEPENETRETDLLMEEMRSFISITSDEAVIGFHHMSRPFEKGAVVDLDTVGSAQFFRGFAVIRDPFFALSQIQKNVVFTHELVHLFGGVHVPEAAAIMNPTLPQRPERVIDPDNREIVLATKDVDFQKGLQSFTPEILEKLIRIYEKLIRQNPHSDFYFQLGSFYKELKQEAKAVAVWEEAVRYQYDNPHIHGALGNYYYQNQNFARAIQELGSAIAHYVLPSQKKQKALTLNYLGVAYFEKGNTDQAIFTWLKGLSEDPDNLILQANLATAYLQSGNVDRAVTEFEKLVAKNPSDPTSLSNLGAAYMKKGDLTKAVDFFERSLALLTKTGANTQDEKADLIDHIPVSMVRANLGSVYVDLGKYEKALTYLKDANSEGIDDFDLHRLLARVYLGLKQYDPALKEIQEALQLKKNDPYLYSFLGQVYSETDRDGEAMQAMKDGLRYATGDMAANFRKNKAMLHARGAEYDLAILEIKSALNLNWNDAECHAQLGMLYLQKQDVENARRSFQTALQMEPNQIVAKQGMDMIKGNR